MNKDRRREVLRLVREQFQLDWQGIHGVPHWARVRWNGLNMAAVNGARADITVQTCWDADRLDLGRVGIIPRPDRLCTEEARDPVLLDIAYRRSVR